PPSGNRIRRAADGSIPAVTLTGSAAHGATLPGTNNVANLGSFSNVLSGDLVFADSGALTQTGTIIDGSGNITLTTASGTLTLNGTMTAGVNSLISLSGAGGITLAGALSTTARTNLVAGSGAYTERGSTVATGVTARSVTAPSFVLTAATSFDSGGSGTTIAAAAGTSLSVGTATGGSLHIGSTDLARVKANGLTLQTTGAGDDVTVAGIAGLRPGPLTRHFRRHNPGTRGPKLRGPNPFSRPLGAGCQW